MPASTAPQPYRALSGDASRSSHVEVMFAAAACEDVVQETAGLGLGGRIDKSAGISAAECVVGNKTKISQDSLKGFCICGRLALDHAFADQRMLGLACSVEISRYDQAMAGGNAVQCRSEGRPHFRPFSQQLVVIAISRTYYLVH